MSWTPGFCSSSLLGLSRLHVACFACSPFPTLLFLKKRNKDAAAASAKQQQQQLLRLFLLLLLLLLFLLLLTYGQIHTCGEIRSCQARAGPGMDGCWSNSYPGACLPLCQYIQSCSNWTQLLFLSHCWPSVLCCFSTKHPSCS